MMYSSGFENFLEDLEFMLDRKASVYWRICWFVITPLILIAIFIYTIATLTPLTYGGRSFPGSAHAAGKTLLCIGVLQIPLWMVIAMMKNRELSFSQVTDPGRYIHSPILYLKNIVLLPYVFSNLKFEKSD